MHSVIWAENSHKSIFKIWSLPVNFDNKILYKCIVRPITVERLKRCDWLVINLYIVG